MIISLNILKLSAVRKPATDRDTKITRVIDAFSGGEIFSWKMRMTHF